MSGELSGPERPASRRLVVYAETLSWRELAAPAVPSLARRHALDVFAAVRPWDVDAWAEAAARWAGEGARLHPWPMLADEDGRWCSRFTLRRYLPFARRVLERAAPGSSLLVDLEPPIALGRRLLAQLARSRREAARTLVTAARRAARSPRPDGPDAAERALLRLLADARSAGVDAACAIVPAVLADGARGGLAQRLLFTPVLGLPWDAVHVMLYTTLVTGYSRGLVGRRAALALLGAGARLSARRFGARAVVGLGATGVGAFGDEATYRAPAELAEDARVARRAGATSLALFELGGLLRRPPAEDWLRAAADPEPAAADRRS